MGQPKRRKTNKGGSRPGSRAATPVPQSRSSSPNPNEDASTATGLAAGKDNTAATSPATPPLVLTSAKVRGIYECDYCHSDISRLPRIRCAECPDFDLCLECFLTTGHTSAIANVKDSAEARDLVGREGKQAPSGGGSASGGGESGGPSSSSWHAASGAIDHNDSHGYRVCDQTRYPMFPSARRVVPSQSRPGSAALMDGTSTAGSSAKGSDAGMEDEEKQESAASETKEDGDGDVVMETNSDHDTAGEKTKSLEDAGKGIKLSSDVTLIPADDLKAVWTVEEDLRLLEGIQSHGLGNWSDIAEVVAGIGSVGKNPKRCMERYFDDFLGRYGHIVPPYTLVVEDTNAADDSKEDGDDAASENKDGASADAGSSSVVSGSVGSIVKDLDPTRLSKRKHSIMKRSTTNPMQSLNRFNNKKMRVAPTETLPEYKAVLELYSDPKVPVKVSSENAPNPPVVRGQEVGRDQSVKAEMQFVKLISSMSKEDADAERADWIENKYMKPGGPTVLPNRPEDVVQLPGAELAGYMPRRGDFDIEWENDAETALADMEFLPGDLDKDKQLKLAVLEIYNGKLEERQKRKEFIKERNLHDYRKNQEEDAKMPRDERDLVRRMRLFERFHHPEEHKKFLNDILKAKKLRKEIAKLQMYRRLGITSLAEAEKYELDKSRRNFHKGAAMQKDSLSKAKSASGSAAAAEAIAASKRDERAEETTNSLWKGYSSTSRRRSINRSQDDSAEPASEPPKENSEEKSDGALKPAADANNEKTDADGEDKQRENSESQDKEEEKEDKLVKTGELDLEDMDDVGYLSEKEKNLCRRIQLTPKQYLECKQVLIHESLKKGLLDKDGPNNKRTVVMIDVEKRGSVIDFMVKAGWLSSKGGAASMSRAISE